MYDAVSNKPELEKFLLIVRLKSRVWRMTIALCFWVGYDDDNCMLYPWKLYDDIYEFASDKRIW